MSTDIKMGRKSRKIMTVMAAVFAVALMIAVPAFAAVDTDAAYTEAEVGFSLELTNPSPEVLDEVGYTKEFLISWALWNEMDLFNTGVFNNPTSVKADSFSAAKAQGSKVLTDEKKSFFMNNVKAEDIEMDYTILADCDLISPYIGNMSEPMKEAAAALQAFIGTSLNAGDKITIIGKVIEESGNDEFYYYKSLDGGKCILTKESYSFYVVDDIDITIKFTTGGKDYEVRLVSTVKGMVTQDRVYEFDGDIKVGTNYTIKYPVSTILSGKTYFEFNGQTKSLVTEFKDGPDTTGTVTEGDIKDQSSIPLDPLVVTKTASMPNESKEGMKIDKTYSAAETAYSNMTMDAVGKDILDMILKIVGIIAAVIVVIIILIIVLIVLKKKKKKQ